MKRGYAFVAVLCLVSVARVFGQSDSDIRLFGYFQTYFDAVPENQYAHARNSFSVQQLDVMLAKSLTADLSAFVNLELTNTFSSEKNWGHFSLADAWVRYFGSNAFSVKAGLLVPAFNNLNEIKNKTPLLPYIIRPAAYEQSFADLIEIEDYIPQQAFIEVYGFVPAGGVKLDYALFAGNSEDENINRLEGNFVPRGIDTTTVKMFGGRVGIQVDGLKAGMSATTDKDNSVEIGLGMVRRYRIGGDLSFQLNGLSFESEVIFVVHSLTDEQKGVLAGVSRINPMVGHNMDKIFAYVNLTYDISDEMFAFAGYDYLRDRFHPFLNEGLAVVRCGGGYRVQDAVVVKAQFTRADLTPTLLMNGYREDHYSVAVSVAF